MTTYLIGRVAYDPTPPPTTAACVGSGALARFGLATRRNWTDENGATSRVSSTIQVRCRGALATHVLASVRKDDQVLVYGHLELFPDKPAILLATDVGFSLRWHTFPLDDEEPEQ